MKHLASFILVAAVLLLFSTCKKNTAAADAPAPADTSFKLSEATLLKQGAFSGNMSYAVSGAAKLYEYKSKKYLYLENYNGSSGPDLRVYISTNLQASQFVSLGKIQANSGNQVYLITSPPDFNTHNKILIWCQQFSVLFGSSSLN